MADPAPSTSYPDVSLTEDDIEALVANGTIELDVEPDPDAHLIQLTRQIAAQYVDRFSSWAASPEEVQTEMAMRALADVDRLAETSGDSVMQRVLATLPRVRGTKRWPTFLQTWIDRIGSVIG